MTLTLPKWEQEISTLENVRIRWDDRLSLQNGQLDLVEGRHTRGYSSRITISDPTAVGDRIQELIKFGKTHFIELQAQRDDKKFYEQITNFQRKIKQLSCRTSDLQYALRTLNPQYCQRYDELFDQAHNLEIEVKKLKDPVKPPLSERPIKHIEYNARTELWSIACFHRKRVPLAETVAAAKQALALSKVKPPQPLYQKSIAAVIKGILFTGAALLTVVKIIILNPIEWLLRGEVRTISPLRWMSEVLKPSNTHTRAYQLYCEQLLRQPRITEDVVKAFHELSGEANCLYLKEIQLTADQDLMELVPFINGKTLPLNSYLDKLKSDTSGQGQDVQLLSRDDINRHYEIFSGLFKGRGESVETFLNKMAINKVKFLSPSKGEPFITRSGLEALLNSAFASPTCREIKLPRSLLQTSYVKNLLKQHSYRFKDGTQYDVTYRRYSLI
jgi:hypothetical protein